MGESKPPTGDCELLRAAREDAEAFGEFYCRHVVLVERWIRRQTPDAATAADLTAETFAQALVGLARFRGTNDEAARAWLFGIARNLLRRYRRRGCVESATVRKLGLGLAHDVDEPDAASAGSMRPPMRRSSPLQFSPSPTPNNKLSSCASST